MEISRLQLWGTAIAVTLLLVVFFSSRSPTDVKPPLAAGVQESMKANWSRPNELTPEVAKHCHVLIDGQPLESGPFRVTADEMLAVDVDVELQPEMFTGQRAFEQVILACRPASEASPNWSQGKQPEFFVGDNRPQRILKGDVLIAVPNRKGPATLDLTQGGLTGDCVLRVYAVISDGAIDGRIAQDTFHYLLAEGHIIVEPAK